MPAGQKGCSFFHLTGERTAEHTNSRAQFLACSASIAADIYSAPSLKGGLCVRRNLRQLQKCGQYPNK